MTEERGISLSTLTTLHVGGAARFLITCEGEDDVRRALARAREEECGFYVLGDGSNVLAEEEGYDGVVIRMKGGTTSYEDEGETVLVTSSAGFSWDALVREAGEKGLWGIENMAGIPGTVGAAPVQNIGAYGVETKDVFVSARVLSAVTGRVSDMHLSDCAFRYRDSRFKHDPTLIILSVTFRLFKTGEARADYSDVKKAKEAGEDLSTPTKVGETVRTIRAQKFPDLAVYGTAGSFFKNPVVTQEKYDELVSLYGAVPSFPHPEGIKVPLAFILDKVLALREFRMGHAWLYGAQPLVLTLDKEGTSTEVEALAREVEKRVKEKTGISIEREVRTMPAH